MIAFEQISLDYGRVRALHAITARLRLGQLTCLVGPNGSGKSTLIKVAAGILHPSAGRVLIDGRPVSGMTGRERAQMTAYLPQTRPVPEMDVLTMIRHGRFPYLGISKVLSPRDHAAVEEAVRLTGIEPLLDRPLSALSGGQRQRVYVAMAIAQDSQVLLLDEPASHLDLIYQLELLSILKTLRERGKTVVMAAHDLPQAFTFSDRVLLIDQGQMVMEDTPEAVVQSGCLQKVFGHSLHALPADSGMLYRYAIG